MNRFEVLRGVNIFLMIPATIIAIIAGAISIVTFNYISIIVTIVFTIQVFALKYTLGGLTMRAHKEYFPHNAIIVPITKYTYYPKQESHCIPAAKIVTED